MIKQILFPFDFSAQGLQAVPFDHCTDGLGTAEDTSLFGLFQEGIQGR